MEENEKVDPVVAARESAAAMELYNHLTAEKDGFESAPRVSVAVQSLVTLMQRMPQGLEQTRWAVQNFAAQDQIRMDNGSDPAKEAADVMKILQDAEVQAKGLASTLERAAGILFSMGAPLGDEDDDEGHVGDW